MRKNGKLTIAFVQRDPCVRAYKQAAALVKRGYTVDLICYKITSQPKIKDVVRNVHCFDWDFDKLAAIVAGNKDWDVIHSHNEPNEPTEVVIKNANGTAVVYDCHDYRGLRQKLPQGEAETERVCFEESHGVVHVSDGMLDAASEVYNSVKALVLPSYPLTDQIPRRLREKRPGNHVVYQGGLLDAGIIPYEYRDYYPFFKRFADEGIHIHAYPASYNPNVLKTYMRLSEESEFFHLHQPLPYYELLEEISQYQWGLAGFNTFDIDDANRIRFLNNALPNKLFDYTFSGVCPIVINNKTGGIWVQEKHVGYYAKDIDELVQIVKERESYPILEDVSEFSMERHIVELEEYYLQILNRT